jgi:hypothetical protein
MSWDNNDNEPKFIYGTKADLDAYYTGQLLSKLIVNLYSKSSYSTSTKTLLPHYQSIGFTPGTLFAYCVKKTNFGRAATLERSGGTFRNYSAVIGFPSCISFLVEPLRKVCVYRDDKGQLATSSNAAASYQKFAAAIKKYARKNKKLEYTVLLELSEVLQRAPTDLLSMALTERDYGPIWYDFKTRIPGMIKYLDRYIEAYSRFLNEQYGDMATFAIQLVSEAQKSYTTPPIDIIIHYINEVMQIVPDFKELYDTAKTPFERKKIVYEYSDMITGGAIEAVNNMYLKGFFGEEHNNLYKNLDAFLCESSILIKQERLRLFISTESDDYNRKKILKSLKEVNGYRDKTYLPTSGDNRVNFTYSENK